MKTVSYLIENLDKYPGFILLVFVKGLLETLPLLLLLLGLLFLSILTNVIGGILLIVIFMLMLVIYAFLLLYWYWLLSLAPYHYILQKDFNDQQPSVWKSISNIFKYRTSSNMFLIIVTIFFYTIFGVLATGVGLTVQTILTPLSLDPTGISILLSLLILTFFSNLVFSPLYFIIGLIKYNYVEIGRAREAIRKGLNMFLDNLGSVAVAILVLLFFNFIFQAATLIISAVLYYMFYQRHIPVIYQFIITGNINDASILRLLEMVLPNLITIVIVLSVFNFIISSFLEFVKLTLVYNIYKQASVKQ